MNSHFVRKSVSRDFKEVDQVLVLLPVVGYAFSARFLGLYKLLKTLSDMVI